MKIIGNRARFAFEIGEYRDAQLRRVDIWAGGTRLCVDDNSAYIPQFTTGLACEIKDSYRISDFSKYLHDLSPIEMAAFVCSTRDEDSPNYGIEDDSIYPRYKFLDLGPTTDNLISFLFRDTHTSFFVHSFWRDAWQKGLPRTYQVVELDFEEIMSVYKAAINVLLDTENGAEQLHHEIR
jgi:hypothetical protein